VFDGRGTREGMCPLRAVAVLVLFEIHDRPERLRLRSSRRKRRKMHLSALIHNGNGTVGGSKIKSNSEMQILGGPHPPIISYSTDAQSQSESALRRYLRNKPHAFRRKSSHKNGCPIHDAVSSRHGWESTNAHAPACKKSSIRRSAHVFPPQIQHRNGCPGACPERSRRVSPLRPGKARLQRPVNTRLHANVPNPHIRISKVHVPVLQIIIPFPRTMEPCPDLRKQER
jgi:hypothetical protein